jgi:hypothetical protein
MEHFTKLTLDFNRYLLEYVTEYGWVHSLFNFDIEGLAGDVIHS